MSVRVRSAFLFVHWELLREPHLCFFFHGNLLLASLSDFSWTAGLLLVDL